MAYDPDLDWQDDGPPGFTAARMRKMQHGIADAARTADDALAAAGTGGIDTVNGDVRRIYSAGTTPEDGTQPGDLVLSTKHSPAGPGAIPGLLTWFDASATGARNLSSVLPDVSGNGNNIGWRDTSGSPASVGSLIGLPAFRFQDSAYWWPGGRTGNRTFSGVLAFTGGIPSGADQTALFTGGDLDLDFGVRFNTGRLFVSAEGSTLWNYGSTWNGNTLYVNFAITCGSSIVFYLNGERIAGRSTSSSRGNRGSLVFSRLTNTFDGVWAEFAEHEGHAATAAEVAELAAYYSDKWRV